MAVTIKFCKNGDKNDIREMSLDLSKIKTFKALRGTIETRLSKDEDVSTSEYNGQTYEGLDDIPFDQLKNGDVITMNIVDQAMDITINGNFDNKNGKNYKLNSSRISTVEELRAKVEDRLPYDAQIDQMSVKGKYMTDGRTIGSQMDGKHNTVTVSMKTTGG